MARPLGTFILPIINPAAFFRDQSLAFTGPADWAKAVRLQQEGRTYVPPMFPREACFPSFEHVVDYFTTNIFNSPHPDSPFVFDFEATLDRQVVCVGLWPCYAPTTSMGICIPFLSQGGVRYWPRDEEQKVRELCRQFFENPLYLKVGQNATGYDTGYPPFTEHSLLKQAWGVDVAGLVGDTLAAHHMCYPELRHGLAFQSSIVTDLSPYKDELWDAEQEEEDDDAADWTRILDLPDERIRSYCLKDCFATALAWLQLEEEMS